jgi:hypothetical protein
MQTIIQVGHEYAGDERAMLWCRRHGLGPARIALPNTFVLDAGQRTVTVMAYYATDADGEFIDLGDELAVVPVTVQLEAPALPWRED